MCDFFIYQSTFRRLCRLLQGFYKYKNIINIKSYKSTLQFLNKHVSIPYFIHQIVTSHIRLNFLFIFVTSEDHQKHKFQKYLAHSHYQHSIFFLFYIY